MSDLCGILVTIEGWGVNLAGCYGNALLPTPNIDRLAACGVVFDQFWMHSVHLEPNLQAIAKKLDPSKWLVSTDSPSSAKLLRQAGNFEVLELAHETDQEAFEHLVTEALECWLQQRQQTPFLWIHSRGLRGDWDAPYEYRKLMCDSDDPDPPSDPAPPSLVLPVQYDPDSLFGWACGAGAQSVCIDQGIGLIQQSITELGLNDHCWIAVAGLQGFPLGEHQRVGLGDRSLVDAAVERTALADAYSERLHTPWILRTAPAFQLGTRDDSLLQPADLGAWIRGITEIDVDGPYVHVQNVSGIAWATGVEEIAIITPRWIARFDTKRNAEGKTVIADEHLGEVYCFPEDRWQQNEIANRVPEVQALLRNIATRLLDPIQDDPAESEQVAMWLAELKSIKR